MKIPHMTEQNNWLTDVSVTKVRIIPEVSEHRLVIFAVVRHEDEQKVRGGERTSFMCPKFSEVSQLCEY